MAQELTPVISVFLENVILLRISKTTWYDKRYELVYRVPQL